ncbi:uncharacterized protein LOC104897042 [Beta vulgaris subsp. vulgaris]|uniref:uncharacterized protein LOC104897042 n=1 Tax=Beta vulgaris subsp. vulgaris TaxID=3555 RepID=UPI000540214E|nr:uncharacterized protein LOC104897042 [Beta vulgaris subsp. vulgaris]
MEVMKMRESTKMGLIVLLGLVIVLSGDYVKKVGALTQAQCHEERQILVRACKPVVFRVPPSGFCCQRLRVTHVECVCSRITPKIAPLIDVNYAISVVQRCGRSVPRHFKCGSITTP